MPRSHDRVHVLYPKVQGFTNDFFTCRFMVTRYVNSLLTRTINMPTELSFSPVRPYYSIVTQIVLSLHHSLLGHSNPLIPIKRARNSRYLLCISEVSWPNFTIFILGYALWYTIALDVTSRTITLSWNNSEVLIRHRGAAPVPLHGLWVATPKGPHIKLSLTTL